MRKLHLVGLTTDRDGLIFTARKGSKSGGYIVPLDSAVLAAVAEVQAAKNGAAGDAEAPEVEAVPRRPRHQSALTPREMQARLRAGRTIEEVAAEAGVDNDWVARFAVPILAEQAQVVELARTLVYAKPRLGESSLPLGASVALNLIDRGVFLPDDVADAGWSAFQLHDSVWMVRFRYRSRGRSQEAQWEVDLPAARLQARNRHASDLGYVDSGGRRKAVVAEEEPVEDEAPSRPGRSRAVSPAKPVAAGVRAARRPAAKRATATRTTKASTAAKAGKAGKVGKVGKVGKAPQPRARKAKAAGAAKGARAGARSAAGGPSPARSGKAPARRASGGPTTEAKRAPAKGRATPEPAPPSGSGGVRSAVAQVSAARVSASLAAAERTPWAAAVRRPTGARLVPRNGRETWQGGDATAREEEDRSGREFQPRPLPSGGEPRPEPVPRVRKVSSNRARPQPAAEPKPVSLPAPRQPVPRTEPIPVERAKRRRLRSR